MPSRARTLLIASLAAIPCLAYTSPCFGHNGRDADPVEFEDLREAVADVVTETGKFRPVDIFSGITVTTHPKTGVRTYTQTGDVPANPARASKSAVATDGEHGVDFWVEQEFRERPSNGPYYAPPQPATQVSSYTDDYYPDYGYGYGYGYGGGYLPIGGYGGGGRPGHGHGGGGGGRPGPGHGGERPRNSGINPDPRRFSPPAGPPGGGVGSPPPYQFGSVGAPAPVQRYNTFGGRRR